MNEPVAEEHFECVGVAVEVEDAQGATCNAVGTVGAAVIVNVCVVGGETLARLLRD